MLESFVAPAINRLLRGNTWALDRLAEHAGKTALLTSPPFELKFAVGENGEVHPAAWEQPPDVTIAASPGVLLRLAARDEAAWTAARVSGDVQFAAAIDYVRRHLVWDYEEDLSEVFGDVAAHRMAGAVRELDRWGRAAVDNLGQAFAEYLIHEDPMLVSARALAEFNREVDEVRDDAARLEKRVALIARALEPTEGNAG